VWVAVVWKRVVAEGVTSDTTAAKMVCWRFCSGGNCVGSGGVEAC
jgi:hypothetical protein